MIDVSPKIIVNCDKAGCQEGIQVTLETLLTPQHDIAGGIHKEELAGTLQRRGWDIGDMSKPIGEWNVLCNKH